MRMSNLSFVRCKIIEMIVFKRILNFYNLIIFFSILIDRNNLVILSELEELLSFIIPTYKEHVYKKKEEIVAL